MANHNSNSRFSRFFNPSDVSNSHHLGFIGNNNKQRVTAPPINEAEIHPETSSSSRPFAIQPRVNNHVYGPIGSTPKVPTTNSSTPKVPITNSSTPKVPTTNSSMFVQKGNHLSGPGGYGLGRGTYSYRPSDLPASTVTFDPYADTPSHRPLPQRIPALMPQPALPQMPQPHSSINKKSFFHGNNAGMTNMTGTGGVSDMYDAANVSAAWSARDAEIRQLDLVNLVLSGATDDPADINYGNCGPQLVPDGRGGRMTAIEAPKARVPRVPGGKDVLPIRKGHSYGAENVRGMAAAFLGIDDVPIPKWLTQNSAKSQPSIEMAFDVLPFIEPCRIAAPSTAGVIRIRNIPYAVSRSEIIAFIGRSAQVCLQPPGSPYYAVHIIMDRHTGKTMDAFVEIAKPSEAVFITNQFERRTKEGRQGKIGDRIVQVDLVTQEDLMVELFPRTKNVSWEGAMPAVDRRVAQYYPYVPATGFCGFLQDEEIVMMTKLAETPQRFPFSGRSAVRVYDSLISTLHKYPWHAHEFVLMDERLKLFGATMATIRALINTLRRLSNVTQHDPTKPRPAVLQELVVAALTCPGFSENQKFSIVTVLHQSGFSQMTVARGMNLSFGGTHSFAAEWPFQVLAKQPGVSDQVVEYFAKILREASSDNGSVSLAGLHAMRASGTSVTSFGNLDIDYGRADNIHDVGRIELQTVENLLDRVLPRDQGCKPS